MADLDKCQFKCPTAILISGPSGSGKSVFTFKLIYNRDKMFDTKFSRVIWAYGVWQEEFGKSIHERNGIKFHEGLPQLDEFKAESPTLLVVDDMMNQIKNKEIGSALANLFTAASHHRNITVVLILQNIFYQSPYTRDLSLNAHYIILFAMKRDKGQVTRLGTQIMPGRHKDFLKVYTEAVSTPHGYLLIEIHPRSKYDYLLRSNILPFERETVYHPV